MKRCIIVLAALLLFAAAQAAQAQAQAQTIKIGVLPVLDALPLQIAVRDGLFEKHGLHVELTPFASALERNTALAGGQLDGYFSDMVDVLLFMRNRTPIRVVTVSYRTTPGQPMFGLATSPARSRRSIDALKAFGVAYSRATVIEYILDAMLQKAGLPQNYFQRVEIKKIPIRMQMLLTDGVALAVLPEPLLDLTKSQGGDVLLTDENLDIPLTVICLKDELALDGATRKAFLAAYGEAVQRINAHPDQYRSLMRETCRIPESLAETFPVYRYPAPSLPAPDKVEAVQQWMLGKKLLKQRIDYARITAPAD
ncbi:MAG: NitT/TauT family transport system substrate-binding protein [Desulfovibrionales bacterium]|jgi:NitT/TauT family transport system substrate-binding protein|nr:NitT/TauT family transport system substrate-binding protein [Desulfovibrionales bacterium]